MPHFRALSGAGMGFINPEGMAYGKAMDRSHDPRINEITPIPEPIKPFHHEAGMG